MDRRIFIGGGVLLVGALGAGAVPLIARIRKEMALEEDPLAQPFVLAHFCDEQTIRDIGTAYRKRFPDERQAEELRKRLFVSKDGAIPATADKQTIREFLDRKIHDEFENDQVLNISGWILSRTEAQQCALLSLRA
jgi:hypothetical protein